jgi:hypothetical protein
VLLISLVLQLGLFAVLWFCAPLRKSSMTVDPNEIEKRAVEVRQRELQRVEQERLRREKVAINEDDASKLRKKAEAKEARKVAQKVREMREIKKRIAEERDASLTRLQQRTLDDINLAAADDLLALAKAAVEASFHLRVRSKLELAQSTEPACKQLQEATAAYLDRGEWSQRDLLAAHARGIRDPLVARIAMIVAEKLKNEDEISRYGLFIHDSNGVIEKLDSYLEKLEAGLAGCAELAAFNDISSIEPQGQSSSGSMADPESMSLDELVTEAATLEESIAKDFNEMRASEMAQIESSTFDEAMANVVSAFARSSRLPGKSPSGESSQPESGDSQSGNSTVGDLQEYRKAQAAKGRQATAHWTKAVNMAQQAGAASSRNQAGRGSDSFKQARSGSPQGQGTGNTQGAAGSRGGDTSKSSRNQSGGGGTAFHSSSAAGGSKANGLRTRISTDMIKAKALPGRRFRKDSKRQGWLFLDTWYVIGPWENDGALNYENAHPPEVAVDLDAEYFDGKLIEPNGSERHPLKWRFVQSDIMRITPPNEQKRSTYYAFTEVYFEEAARMLVAIATDDAARMWVNDKLVWEDQGQSAWNLDEGFRVIDFKQGFNKILARIENSPTLCEFSVLLCPPDQVGK